MDRRGSVASPAVMPMSSTPPKLNMTTTNPSATPEIPVGKNPPSFHRFATPVGAADGAPMTMTHAPSSTMAMIATTLTMANQNSNSP